MNFAQQGNNGNNYWASYVLTILLLFITLLVSSLMAEGISQAVLGHSLSKPVLEGESLNGKLALMILPFALTLTTLLLCVKFIHKRSIKSILTSRDKYDWKRFFVAFALWGGIQGIYLAYQIASGDPISFQFDAGSFFPLLFIAVALVPLQTAAEDVLFRGYVFQGFMQIIKNGVLNILIIGAIFGWLHSRNPEVELLGNGVLIYYIMSGVFLGLLTHLDDGLELGMGYHAANNIFGTLIITSDWQALQSDALFVDNSPPAFGLFNILTIALIQPLLIIVFSKIYRWKGIKDKLTN